MTRQGESDVKRYFFYTDGKELHRDDADDGPYVLHTAHAEALARVEQSHAEEVAGIRAESGHHTYLLEATRAASVSRGEEILQLRAQVEALKGERDMRQPLPLTMARAEQMFEDASLVEQNRELCIVVESLRAEVERLKTHELDVAKTATDLLGSDLCAAHMEEARTMPFPEFAANLKSCGCRECNRAQLTLRDARLARLEAVVRSVSVPYCAVCGGSMKHAPRCALAAALDSKEPG